MKAFVYSEFCLITVSISSPVIDSNFVSSGSVLEGCVILKVYPILLRFPTSWYIIVHSVV